MYLKRLDMQGFKSFPQKISLSFGSGLTAIVGPNGSGKSNISDAIRWVMGEQSVKTLRGSKMEDVIFAGTEKLKALGFAEVSLVLNNAQKVFPIDYEEITVTRRVYRSGESEYLINKTPCRLKDIHGLFMDTGLGRGGYSVIGQGKIDEILSAKSEDRRQIFEEAAGISKYRYKSAEAERKLLATEENLLRVGDIVSELEAQVGPLEAQSKKALRFLDLREELKALEVNVAIDSIAKLREQSTELESLYNTSRLDVAKARETLEELQEKEKRVFDKMREHDGEIEKLRERLHSADLLKTQGLGEISLFNNNIENLKNNLSRIDNDIISYKNEIGQTHAQIKEEEIRLEQLKGDKIRLEEMQRESLLKESEETKKISELNAHIIEIQNTMARITREADDAQGRLDNMDILNSNFKERVEDIEHEIEKAESRKKSLMDSSENLAKQIEGLNKKLEDLKNSLEENKLKRESIKARVEELKAEYNDKSSEYNRKMSRLSVLQEMEKTMEGYGKSVRAILNENLAGVRVHGVLSRLINVPDKFATAIEIALGAALQNLVVDDESDAKAAIKFLKERNLGRATFLPISSVKGIKSSFNLEGEKGFLGFASDLVSCNEKYKNIILHVLGRCAVVDNIDSGIKIAKKFSHRFKIVTLEGEVLNVGGSITGGSTAKNAQLIGRRKEIKALLTETDKLEKYIDDIDDKIYGKNESIEAERRLAGDLNREYSKVQEEIIRLKGERELSENLIQRETAQISRLSKEILSLKGQMDNSGEEKERLKKVKSEAQSRLAEISKEYEKARNEIRDKMALRDAQSTKTVNIKMEISSVDKDMDLCMSKITAIKERQNKILEQITLKEEERLATENSIEEITLKIKNKKIDIEESVKRSEEFKAFIEEFTLKKGCFDDEIAVLKEQVSSQNDTIYALQEECARLENRLTKAKAELELFITRLWDDYELTYSSAIELRKDIGDKKEAKSRISLLKSEIKKLGNINIDAIEEYKKVKKRYEFLKTQVTDLEKAKADFEKLIRELTKVMKEMFAEQFKTINQNFGEVFTELFGGGTARLKLADPTNILESGIEIDVQPPGKKLQNINLLSGGEKAFTAIALLFAILKVRPTPFCILDEIEAALDDNNVTRFAQYIKGFCDKTQFIVVTHRRGTMEAADILYGVTMQEKGVSKLLAMRFDDEAV